MKLQKPSLEELARWAEMVLALPPREANRVLRLMNAISIVTNRKPSEVPLPVAFNSPTPGAFMVLIWDSGDLVLDVELFRDGTHHIFVRNRKTGAFDGSKNPITWYPIHLLAVFSDMIGVQ